MDRLDPRRCATPQVVARNENESGPRPANQIPWQERSGPAGWGVRKEGAGLRERAARRGRLLGGAADQTSSTGRRALPCREDLSGGPAPCGAWQERSGPGMEGVQALADDAMPGWLLGAEADQKSSDGSVGGLSEFSRPGATGAEPGRCGCPRRMGSAPRSRRGGKDLSHGKQ
jgi:hypothetical protein